MGLNLSEIILVVIVIALVIGFGQLPAVAEAIGRFRRDALQGGKGTVNITPDQDQREASLPPQRAPDSSTIQGPVEDAELIEPS